MMEAGTVLKRTLLAISILLMSGAARADLLEIPLAEGLSEAQLPSGSARIEFSKEPGLTNFPDPRCPTDSVLQLRTDHQSVDIPLDCANWSLDPKRGSYVFNDPAAGDGDVSHIEWRSVRLAIDITTQQALLSAPVAFVESRLVVGARAYCAHFDRFLVNGSGIIAGDSNASCNTFNTPTPTPTQTSTSTRTFTSTRTRTPTRTFTLTRTFTPTITSTPTQTTTGTIFPTDTPTETATPTITPTVTNTSPPTLTPTRTGTPTVTGTQTPTATLTPEPPTAFRFRTLSLVDPPPYAVISGSCTNLTTILNALIISPLLNQDAADDMDSFLDLSPMLLFRPLTQPTGGANVDITFADCLGPVNSETCVAGDSVPQSTTYANQTSGTCLSPVAGTATGGGTVTSPTAPCFVTGLVSQTFQFGTFTIPLQNAQVAARYNANPATSLTTGLLAGFLSKSAAEAIFLPQDLPPDFAALAPGLAGAPLGSLFRGGAGNCAAGSDLDTGPGGQLGWYFYLSYSGGKVSYTQ